jgi:hypothetical protein
VSEFWANRRGESIRVQFSEFKGRSLVDVRKYFTAPDGTMRPTKKGFSIAIARLPELARAFRKAIRKAGELGLIDVGETDHE